MSVIDDAHLMSIDNLRKLRLLPEDFPKNHKLILVGQVELLAELDLSKNTATVSHATFGCRRGRNCT
ncbi:MAG: hypothetical protein ACF8AM_09330 [Rhodopirellula sp. JB055]|uniref:hypothetical protein n=1 Tax=Rhodopirellula sp. JB055 TaxID=3342846 RepID=UPI00370BA65A